MTNKEKLSNLNIRKIKKIILYTLLISVLCAIAAFIYWYINFFIIKHPVVLSDSNGGFSNKTQNNKRYSEAYSILSYIEELLKNDTVLDKFPKNVHNRYVGSDGSFLFADIFVSFQFRTDEDFKLFVKENKLDRFKFKDGSLSQEGPWNYYFLPNQWEDKYQDANWPLSEDDHFKYFGSHPDLYIYTPEDRRFCVCIDTGP